jgi:hypothetical protein
VASNNRLGSEDSCNYNEEMGITDLHITNSDYDVNNYAQVPDRGTNMAEDSVLVFDSNID